MKSKLIILFLFCASAVFAQVCAPNGISTDPDNPINLDAPDPKFINEFNWFQRTIGSQLMNIPIYDFESLFNNLLKPDENE